MGDNYKARQNNLSKTIEKQSDSMDNRKQSSSISIKVDALLQSRPHCMAYIYIETVMNEQINQMNRRIMNNQLID